MQGLLVQFHGTWCMAYSECGRHGGFQGRFRLSPGISRPPEQATQRLCIWGHAHWKNIKHPTGMRSTQCNFRQGSLGRLHWQEQMGRRWGNEWDFQVGYFLGKREGMCRGPEGVRTLPCWPQLSPREPLLGPYVATCPQCRSPGFFRCVSYCTPIRKGQNSGHFLSWEHLQMSHFLFIPHVPGIVPGSGDTVMTDLRRS